MKYFVQFSTTYGVALGLIFLILILVFFGIRAKKSLSKQILFNSSAVFIAILLYELYLFSVIPNERTYMPLGYFAENPYCGYGPGDSANASVNRIIDGQEIYEAEYTIRDSMRFTPNSSIGSKSIAVFLGGSFMFGEGLSDKETIPYLFNELNNNEYELRNYGFHGYGIHQALALAENRILKEKKFREAEKLEVYYLFIPDHIRRAAGHSSWDLYGPKYEVEDGELEHKGGFDIEFNAFQRTKFYKVMLTTLAASNIYKAHFMTADLLKDKDIQRAQYILKELNRKLTDAGINFTLIIDSEGKKDWVGKAEIEEVVRAEGITTIFCDELLPEIFDELDSYYFPLDGHPQKLHNALIAKELTRLSTKSILDSTSVSE